MPADKPTELSRINLKPWTRQPVPMISEHSAHSTPLPVGIRTWLWRFTCLLLLISMLWHRPSIVESKGDKLSSFAEYRIRTQRVSGTESPADWMPADKPQVISLCAVEILNVSFDNFIHIYVWLNRLYNLTKAKHYHTNIYHNKQAYIIIWYNMENIITHSSNRSGFLLLCFICTSDLKHVSSDMNVKFYALLRWIFFCARKQYTIKSDMDSSLLDSLECWLWPDAELGLSALTSVHRQGRMRIVGR